MVEVKDNLMGGLNLDASYYKVPKNAYTDALNITRDAIEGNNDYDITNIVGNRIVTNSLPTGTNKCIGARANEIRNTVIFFNYNSNGNHGIYEYDNTTRTITKIFINLTDSGSVDILGFTANDKINNINIYNRDEGDLLYFLDSLGRPTGLNIARFKAGEYTPVTRQIINVIKAPPLQPPTCVYGNDTTRNTNDLRNKFFRFKTLFVYDDNEQSCTSPISQVQIPTKINNNTYTDVITNNNVLSISIPTGAKNVKAIKLLMSYVDKTNDWSDFAVVDTFDKSTLSIGDDTLYNYNFYNDSSYPYYDIKRSIELYDYVPDKAKAQEMPNGNVLAYGAITEGYDRILTPNVTITVNTRSAGSSGGVGDLVSVPNFDGEANIGPIFYNTWSLYFGGNPAVGTVVNVKIQKADLSFIIIATYTTVLGDTAATVATNVYNNLVATITSGIVNKSLDLSGTPRVKFWAQIPTYLKNVQVEITPPATSAADDSIATWLWSTQRSIGLVYFDQNGKTNGVLYNSKVVFPAYSESGGQIDIPYINSKIYHVPPIWAYSYQWVVTKEATYPYFWYTPAQITDSDYIYFDVTNIDLTTQKLPTTTNVLTYKFQDGDRLRLIKNVGTGTVYADTYDAQILGEVTDPTINGAVKKGNYLKIKKISPFSSLTFDATTRYVIEIYRLSQSLPSATNAPYFEFGQQYPILNPGTSDRVHSGAVTIQDIGTGVPAESNFYYGDTYFRLRTIQYESGGGVNLASFYVQDRNVVDIYISAVSSLEGRSTIIDINARQAYYPNLVRFGQAYQPNTNINGLNQFFPLSFLEVEYSYGDIMRFKVRDRFMRVYQKLKIGQMPIFSQISKDNTGNQILVNTDKLLNPVQYYIGDFGIGDNAESLTSYNFADYCTSNIKGTILRVSQDGVVPISVTAKIDSWATQNIPLRSGNYKIYGAFNQRLGQYIAALEETPTSPAQTIVFDEDSNTFESFISLFPEMMTTLGVLLISFKNGQLYTHDSTVYNNFFGVQYDSNISIVFNSNPYEKKTFHAVSEVASQVWDCPEVVTDNFSYGTTYQTSVINSARFKKLESNYHANIPRDSNSRGGLVNGSIMKGNYAKIKFRAQNPTDLVTLSLVSLTSVDSPLTAKS